MKKLNCLWIATFISLQLLIPTLSNDSDPSQNPPPTATPWPEQFHALLINNMSDDKLMISNFWYDWPSGRNVYIRQKQQGPVLYDVQWKNGTSFYYTLGENPTCTVTEYGVGITRPDFLDGADYLGTAVSDGFLCHLWEKVDFIWYYEDVETKVPIRWNFNDDISTHVIKFEAGKTLSDDSITQAPSHCFTNLDKEQMTKFKDKSSLTGDFPHPSS